MTVQQVIGLAVPLVAIYFGLQVVQSLRLVFSLEDASSFYFSAVLYATTAVWLWLFPMSVAHRLLPKTVHNDKIITNTNQLAVAGVALLGLWLFAVSTPSVLYVVLFSIMESGKGISFFNLLIEDNSKAAIFFANFLQAIFALVLLFNARKIARLITK
ncbi:hypothetical protein GCM10009007_15150 [Formosimonas limnophila]|uniref:Uncharacterized protein n=1 Tax=Formosimonas limnophila TaxID=1384487 RepID=A0A8J3CNB6_9BURK|nr:hypothetical protein [Formosimonas limnophila]GHA75009.1 hypothetical protein GCM10009007_15150 [Formosimonas limnophila]